VETAHPVYHELDVTWRISGGRPVPNVANARHLHLGELGVGPGDTITVTVVDPTEFVRDPALRDEALTATRSWIVGTARGVNGAVSANAPAFTRHTPTDRPVGGRDVVYAETAQPGDRLFDVRWELNGQAVPNPGNRRTFHLGRQQLNPGTHTLQATVLDPATPDGPAESLRWVVDNVPPSVTYHLAPTVAATTDADGTPHYVMTDGFTMKLDAHDDQPGHVVAEFRVNGRGWHHYYGWPDAPADTPFRFTPRGTNIKELIYGSLSAEGLSPQPWEAREPGWGTHTIEYRAIDAAGNIGETRAFRVTLRPGQAGPAPGPH
jgi:hypothetical protein